MRASCNGCRILRKGCSDDCVIRPSLTWIPNPDHQANATLFLAKFHGRAGLLNLLSAAPQHRQHAVFRSLLYEACGRIVNPIYGSVGLLWTGKWNLCQAAVEAVLQGAPVMQMAPESTTAVPLPPHKAFDIRHVAKDEGRGGDLHKVTKTAMFRRSTDHMGIFNQEGRSWEAFTRESAENESVVSVEMVEFATAGWRWSGDDNDLPVTDSMDHANVMLELGLSLGGPWR